MNQLPLDLDRLKISLCDSLADVVARIQASRALGCALIYDDNGHFVNIVTDGDIRRAFLEGKHVDATARDIHEIKLKSTRPTPITAHVGSTHAERIALFRQHSLRQLILVDAHGTPVDIIDHQDINSTPAYVNQRFTAVVMAGGFGTRLRPLTADTPKPMLNVNGRPMLEISIEKLISYGASRIFISTHYLPEKIVNHFGNGERFGIPIEYIHEETPLGTGGALSLLSSRDDTTLVFNGDILTTLDVSMFLAYHLRTESAMSIAATQYSFQVPFGVVGSTGSQVTHIEEKPKFSFLINSGIYFLSPSVLASLPQNGPYHMTDVAHEQIRRGANVSCFPVFEHWLDVGRPSDYDLAAKLF
ncbi:D-glycero-d-manno-heptose 1-phosphate guanosyltransferase [Caballeronia calidae]|uniref:D-glycero-d-manno-heptose 1-phosphate guanosyltransferase n=1 Tax=Caballeronia calidae TaxID=1777139 RepID=A0A158EJ09_9BURK|nr:nucleotidyltransferase family protein [Caballeronia calidae]SAL06763.1 D-glycero-d-manno-heptose 1-phosphate guanosyltransferase [Caballeronia calidae]